MSKVLYFAGVSRVAGELKFRTATEASRFQQLSKLGDTDVEMVSIPGTESKQAAAQELLSRNFANGRADIQALLEAVASKNSTVKVTTKKPRVTAVKKEKRLSVEEANAIILSTMREVTEKERLARLVFGKPKKRRSRKTVETV